MSSPSFECRCGHDKSRVTDSRWDENNKSIRRRRECKSCGFRWTTVEVRQDVLHSVAGDSMRVALVRAALEAEL